MQLCGFAAALVMAVVIAYLPALRAGYIWDDDTWLTENRTLRAPGALWRIWFRPSEDPQYYPLTLSLFWLERQLWALAPFGYHLVNVLLHGCSAIMLWILLRRLALPGAWLAAALFALHPVQVESVAWITERKNVLSGFFYLAAALAYVRFSGLDSPPASSAGSDASGSPPAFRWKPYVLCLALFLCAMFSKTVASSFPAAALLVVYWKRGRITRHDVLPLVPMFLVGAALGMLTAWIEKNQVGASGEPWQLSMVERTLIAGRAVWFYAAKLAWPDPLVFCYPRWSVSATTLWQYLFPVTAVAVVIALWLLRKRIGRGPLVAVLFFGGTVFPALGFVNVYPMQFSFVADHFQYVASLGLITLAAAGASRLAGRRMHALVAAGTLVLAVLGVLTWRQSKYYRNEMTLWEATLAVNPEAWLAHSNLGVLLAAQGRVDEAIGHYQESLRVNPRYADTHYCLGNALSKLGRKAEAIEAYRRSLELRPSLYRAHYNWGNILLRQRDNAGAAVQYEMALRVNPDYPEAHNNAGQALSRSGRLSDAVRHFAEAVRLRPDYSDAYNNWGAALLEAGRAAEAIPLFKRALQINPINDGVRMNLQMAEQQAGRSAGQ
jgi:protein O-mannosyl-transferase